MFEKKLSSFKVEDQMKGLDCRGLIDCIPRKNLLAEENSKNNTDVEGFSIKKSSF